MRSWDLVSHLCVGGTAHEINDLRHEHYDLKHIHNWGILPACWLALIVSNVSRAYLLNEFMTVCLLFMHKQTLVPLHRSWILQSWTCILWSQTWILWSQTYLQQTGFTCGVADLLLKKSAEKQRRKLLKPAGRIKIIFSRILIILHTKIKHSS